MTVGVAAAVREIIRRSEMRQRPELLLWAARSTVKSRAEAHSIGGAAGGPADRIQSLESGQTDCSCRRGHLGSIGADYSSVQPTRYSQST
jgi:hypothetical protein